MRIAVKFLNQIPRYCLHLGDSCPIMPIFKNVRIHRINIGVLKMYAVITSGSKQFTVKEGQTLKLEKIDAEVGSNITFDDILMISNGDNIQIGKPYVTGAKVTATIVEHGRHKKLLIVKFRRRKHHKKQMGHRQYYTEVKIEQIVA